jgi:Xaa-Pro aminopeptidase
LLRPHSNHLFKVLPPSSRVALDPTLITVGSAKTLREELGKSGHKLVSDGENFIDIVWGSERPSRPSEPIFILEEKYSGKSITDKISLIREKITSRQSFGIVVSGKNS